jgi:hypothetical protein
MASRSTSVKATSKPNKGQTTKPNKGHTTTLAKFLAGDISPETDEGITPKTIFNKVAEDLTNFGIPEAKVQVIINYMTDQPVAPSTTSDDTSEDVAFAIASKRASGGGAKKEDDHPFTSYEAHVALVTLIVAVNRLFKEDKLKAKLSEGLRKVFEDFRTGLYEAPYAFEIPKVFDIPEKFRDNLRYLGLVPNIVNINHKVLLGFLGAHIAGLSTIGVTIELSQQMIDLASSCTRTEVAINWNKIISQEQREQIRVRFGLALASINYAVPRKVSYIPKSLTDLLVDNFDNLVELLSSINTAPNKTRLDNFASFMETPLFDVLSGNKRFEIDPDHLDRIFGMLPKFSWILHQAGINVHRFKSNQKVEYEKVPAVTNKAGVETTPAVMGEKILPRLQLTFQGVLAESINRGAFNAALKQVKNHVMINMTFVSAIVASILVAIFVNENSQIVDMLTEFDGLFAAYDENVAAIKDSTGSDKTPLYTRGNEIVTKVLTHLQNMYDATKLKESISPLEATLFEAFFKDVSFVIPNQTERKPLQAAFQGLSSFDVADVSAFPSFGVLSETGAPEWKLKTHAAPQTTPKDKPEEAAAAASAATAATALDEAGWA